MSKMRHISVNIEDETLQKFHYVSKYEARSASGQIIHLITKCIREFEEEHGKIEIENESEKGK